MLPKILSSESGRQQGFPPPQTPNRTDETSEPEPNVQGFTYGKEMREVPRVLRVSRLFGLK